MKAMMTEDILKEIKQSFRLMMNGPASQSMRQKGVGYKLNWGVPFPQLRAMAADYGKDYHLAIALWKEDIRECKILATLIMPADEMPCEVAELWLEQVPNQEMAEMLAFNLLQHADYAPEMAYEAIASSRPLYQIFGFSLLGRLFMRGLEPNDRGANEFLDQVAVALKDSNVGVQHAALNCLLRFADLGPRFTHMVPKSLADAYLM